MDIFYSYYPSPSPLYFALNIQVRLEKFSHTYQSIPMFAAQICPKPNSINGVYYELYSVTKSSCKINQVDILGHYLFASRSVYGSHFSFGCRYVHYTQAD